MRLRMVFFFVILLLKSHLSIAQPTLLWKFRTGSQVHSSATIKNQTVFFGSEDSCLYALDKQTGSLKWHFRTGGAINSTPVASNGMIFFNSMDGYIYSVDEEKGRLIWKFKTKGEVQYDIWDYYLSSPIVNNGILYIGSGDSNIYAINIQNGQCLWRYKTNGIVHATPLCTDKMVYIGSFDGYFYALDANKGELIWRFKTVGDKYFPKGEIQRGATMYQNSIIFGSRDYNIYALDATHGTGRWNMKEIGSWIIATPLVSGNDIYFGTSDSHRFYCMDAESGEVKWTLPLSMRVYGTACVSNNNIAFGCFNGKLYIVNQKNGQIVSSFQTDESNQRYPNIYKPNGEFRDDFELYGKETNESERKILSLGSILSDLVVENGIIYFGDANGNFYALKTER